MFLTGYALNLPTANSTRRVISDASNTPLDRDTATSYALVSKRNSLPTRPNWQISIIQTTLLDLPRTSQEFWSHTQRFVIPSLAVYSNHHKLIFDCECDPTRRVCFHECQHGLCRTLPQVITMALPQSKSKFSSRIRRSWEQRHEWI